MVQSELIKENSADEVYILAPLTQSLKCQGVYFTIKEKVFETTLIVIEKINTFLFCLLGLL